VLISFIIAARVVDFQDPTPPVTNKSHDFLSEKLRIISGMPKESNSGICDGIIRKTSPNHHFSLKPFTLNLHKLFVWIEKSSSNSVMNFSCKCQGMNFSISVLSSLGSIFFISVSCWISHPTLRLG
jgi:hypothetical protein